MVPRSPTVTCVAHANRDRSFTQPPVLRIDRQRSALDALERYDLDLDESVQTFIEKLDDLEHVALPGHRLGRHHDPA